MIFYIILLISYIFIIPVQTYNAGEGDIFGVFPTYTHHTIEEVGLSMAGFTQDEVKRVYFGNWLRDYSQLNGMPIRKFLSSSQVTQLVRWQLPENLFTIREPGDYHITEEDLGVAKGVEHFGNPAEQKKSHRHVDSRFEGIVNPEDLEVDPIRMEKVYFKQCIDYMRKNIYKSLDAYKASLRRDVRISSARRKQLKRDAFKYFGFALHNLEDFFSHSNWAELALIEIGYTRVYSWVGKQSKFACGYQYCSPVVTGSWGSKDHSTLLLDMVQKSLIKSLKVKQSLLKRELPMLHRIRLKEDEKHMSGLDKVLRKATLSLLSVTGDAKEHVLSKLTQTYYNSDATDPTHSQINKDYNFHPLHMATSKCAINAVAAVAIQMKRAWKGLIHPEHVMRMIESFTEHPFIMKQRDSFAWRTNGQFMMEWAFDNQELVSRLDVQHALRGSINLSF